MLITSLALLARSRAWVVFRRVGVAAPARRRFRAIAQWVTGRIPDRFRVGRRCGATARAHAHRGSERGLRGLGDMAVPSLGNHWVTVDPIVGGSLEDASCDLIS